MCFPEPAPAVQTLEYFREARLPVAVVLADHWMPDMTGAQLLAPAHELHAQAKRVLLFAWGDRTSQCPIREASALGLMDTYAPKPSQSPDEQFHRIITELLEEWSQTQGPRFIAVRIVGHQWAPRSHQLRDLLGRNGIPFEFHPADSVGRSSSRGTSGRLPVLFLYMPADLGTHLVDPSNDEIAR